MTSISLNNGERRDVVETPKEIIDLRRRALAQDDSWIILTRANGDLIVIDADAIDALEMTGWTGQ